MSKLSKSNSQMPNSIQIDVYLRRTTDSRLSTIKLLAIVFAHHYYRLLALVVFTYSIVLESSSSLAGVSFDPLFMLVTFTYATKFESSSSVVAKPTINCVFILIHTNSSLLTNNNSTTPYLYYFLKLLPTIGADRDRYSLPSADRMTVISLLF